MSFTNTDFKKWRASLSLESTSQAHVKDFLAAKDVKPEVDVAYLNALTSRVSMMAKTLHTPMQRKPDRDAVLEKLDAATKAVSKNDYEILKKLSNYGRRREQVFFNWLRGLMTVELLMPTIESSFECDGKDIAGIGDDKLDSVETFNQTPAADLQVTVRKKIIRVEVQGGFQGIHDVKEHKVREAEKHRKSGTPTILFHADFFNGQLAILRLDKVDPKDSNWESRQQMEGQSVFSIPPEDFHWLLSDAPKTLRSFGLL